MMGLHMLYCFFGLAFISGVFGSQDDFPSFDENYKVTWGHHNFKSSSNGRDVQLSLDRDSGAGIQSKLSYGSGSFRMSIKLPSNDSAGVVTTFYLKSHRINFNELDFEFLGNKRGKPHIVQTNVYTHGKGDREQRIKLWFDPTAHFHNYTIIWNQHQIVFLIDEIPIRVFRNNTKIGVGYPTQPMHVEASIWNDGAAILTDGTTILTTIGAAILIGGAVALTNTGVVNHVTLLDFGGIKSDSGS